MIQAHIELNCGLQRSLRIYYYIHIFKGHEKNMSVIETRLLHYNILYRVYYIYMHNNINTLYV